MAKELMCSDCGQTFTFTDEEQAFFQQKGFNEPKRCKRCRDAKKAERGGSRRDSHRDRH
ncbi:MAG: zinc-ribbon domain containing protein [Acidobacteria bacterium]|nr:zinc-ribbon domain containing protein [Acidobacteriota bacterium]MBI3655822.1 zinc-ribbon domain containing protein [Acidobacteriota bacterium]